MYTVTNFKTKKALRDAVALRDVPVYQPGDWPVRDGGATVEGPHYPEPHRWYARVTVRDGMIPRGTQVR